MTIRYTRPKHDYNRTLDYRFTVDRKDDPAVIELKKSVADHNKWVRSARRKGYDWADGSCKLQRVRMKGRGPRNSSIYHTTDDEAQYWDVYVGFDTHNHYQLQRELDTGLTQSELREHDKLKHQLLMLEWKGKGRKRAEK